jgi:hypothetical protein
VTACTRAALEARHALVTDLLAQAAAVHAVLVASVPPSNPERMEWAEIACACENEQERLAKLIAHAATQGGAA